MPDIFTKEAAPSYKRVDAHMLDPRDLRLNPDLNGRVEAPDIDKFIADFRNPKVGQLQAITITKIDGYPVIVDGHSRWQAALKLTELGEGPFGGVFKLRCTYFVGTPMECFIATIKANIRNEPTPADDAFNISRLIHNFGMDEEYIATDVYRRVTLDGKPDMQWVRERAALADLAPEGMEALTNGTLKPKAAVVLAKLSKKIQREKLKALADGGKLTVASLKRDANPGAAPVEYKTRKVSLHKPTIELVKVMIQSAIDDGINSDINKMSVENAGREVLGQLLDKIG